MKLGTLRNPKFLRLARSLQCGKAAAAGHLEALWAFTSEQAPAGDVGRWLDGDIEEACFWEGEPGALVAAFVATGWLDVHTVHRLIVHEWGQHASEMIRKRNKRAGIEFVTADEAQPEEPPTSSGEGEPNAVSSGRQPDGGHPADSGGRTADHQTPSDPTPPDQTSSLAAARPPCAPQRASPAEPEPRKQGPKTLCPDVLEPPDRDALLRWSKSKGFSESECRWAFNAVKDWSHANAERRADWAATTRNAMRKGWALEGYRETDQERYAREMAESPFAQGDPDAVH